MASKSPILPKGFHEPIQFLIHDISWMDPRSDLTKEAITLRNQELERIRLQKLAVLVHFHGLDIEHPDFWKNLALKLAYEHIPAFAVGSPIKLGRKRTWSDTDRYKLWYEVQRLIETHKAKNAHDACSIVFELGKWNSKLRSKAKPIKDKKEGRKLLYDQYLKSQKSPWVNIAERSSADDSGIFNALYLTFSTPKN